MEITFGDYFMKQSLKSISPNIFGLAFILFSTIEYYILSSTSWHEETNSHKIIIHNNNFHFTYPQLLYYYFSFGNADTRMHKSKWFAKPENQNRKKKICCITFKPMTDKGETEDIKECEKELIYCFRSAHMTYSFSWLWLVRTL